MMTDSSNAGAVEHFDTGPLSWVMGEIRDALAQSAALVVQAASQEPGARQAGLRQARIFLHQAHGALQMVDVDGVTVVTGAAESILEGLREEGQPLSAPIAEAMADAFQAVGEYLEALLAGAPHQPVRLFPYYQALLQAHGGGRIHPSDLFFPDLAVRPKLPPAPPGARADTAALRQRYEKALLPFLKSTERAAELSSAAVMRDVLAEVERAPQDDEARAFWWVMRGFAALGAAGGLASEVYVKQVFARINLQLRRLGQAGVVNERVLRDALFFIAQAGDPPPEAAQIRQVYRLEGMVPEDFSSRRYGRIDEQALAAAREQLAQAKSLWNRVAAGDGAAAAAFGQAMQGLTAAGGRLDSPSLAKLLRELNGIARHAAHSNPGDTLGLEVAGSLLFIENALAHASRLADDFPQRADALTARLLALVAGERPGEETQWLDDMSRAAQQRETMLAVAGEMQASLAQVEKNLDEYFSNPAHQGVLEPTDAVLHQIEGALAIIDQDEARQAVVHLREALRGFAQAGPGHADQEAFRRVAGNVGALSFFIENLQVDSEGAAKRFGFDPESGVFQSRLLEQRGGTAREVVVDPLPQSWAGESGVETIELAPPPAEPETAGPAAAAESPAEPRDELLAEPSGTLAQSAAASPAGSPEMEPAAFAPAAGAGEDAVAGHENWLEPDDAPDADATVAAMPVQVAPANPLPASDEAADAELLEIFLTEASEVLETVQAATPELRRDPGSLEHMTTLRRSFHTLKGSSRMVGLAVFGEAAWAIEQVFNRRLADGQEGSPGLYSLLDLAVEELGGWVAELAQSGHSARNGAALVAAAHRVRNGQPALAEAETEVQAQERGAAAPALPSHPEDADPVLAPAIPDTPAAPGMPELPDMADAIAEPAVAGMPGPGELPEAIGMAEASDAAAGSDTQKAADIPEAADVSAAPDMPAAPDTLEPSDAANASDVPAASEATEAAGLTETPGMADSYAMPESRGAGQASGTGEGAAAAQPAPTGKVIEFPDVHRTQLPADDNVKHIGALEISVPLHNIYLAETDELVRLLAQDLAEWRHEPERAVNILAVHAAHSLAGSSATVGFAAVHEIAHALEMILQQLARKHVPLKPAEFDAAERAVACMKGMLQKFALCEMPLHEPQQVRLLKELKEQITARSGGSAPAIQSSVPAFEAEEDSAELEMEEAASAGPDSHPVPALPRDELDPDLLPVFLEEGRDILPRLGELLRRWQQSPADPEPAPALLRLLHTIKGSARMAGAMGLGQHMHDMESRIEQITRMGQPGAAAIEDLLGRLDAGLVLFEHLQNPQAARAPVNAPPRRDDSSPVAGATGSGAGDEMVLLPGVTPVVLDHGVPAATSAPPVAVPLVRVRADILDRLVNQAGEVSISRSRVETEVSALRQSLSELTENLQRLRGQLREVEIQAESQMASHAKSLEREFDPLEFDRFTRLQELTRMMAETVGDVASVQQTLNRTADEAGNGLAAQARLTRELQQDLMRVRMVQFASIAERLYRVTRQVSKEMDKRVNLDIHGGSVEMDRSVLEKMAGPFEHLLRNAIVHGIEARNARHAAGKNETGELLIEVRQEGNEVVIQFSDDGRGLDLGRIRARAIERGMLEQGQEMPESELKDLIFHPGFSTASEITELAGRGVGMDVVRSEALSLGGRVAIDSDPGKGAQFTIHLPLTLAVTQVVVLTTGARTYAVPSVLVEQVQQLKANALAAAYNEGAVAWQRQRVPLYYLSALLGDRESAPVTQQYSPIVILKSGNDRVAIHVDEVQGNREVVVKNIGPQLSRMAGIAGATVLGAGEIVLILDPVPLAQRLQQDQGKAPGLPSSGVSGDMGAIAEMALPQVMASAGARSEPVQGLRAQPIVMVVDDSLTVRRVTQRLLAREGYQVALAKDGVDALEQLQAITPDVMLVDIEMPRMDGFDLTRNVRGDERTRHIPIVMITSRTATKHRNYALELGVNEYLGKPYQENDLLKLIAGYVAGEAPVA